MKKLIPLLLITFLSCFSIKAQEANKIQTDPKNGTEMIVGEVTREGLANLSTWSSDEYKFSEEYALYSPDSLYINYLKQNIAELPYIFVVLGTWCGDSKDQVPHFLKIVDLVGYPKEKIFMVAVDRDKKGGDFCLADFEINLVPTFILTKEGVELGRIIETPITTIEQDLVTIIKGNQ